VSAGSRHHLAVPGHGDRVLRSRAERVLPPLANAGACGASAANRCVPASPAAVNVLAETSVGPARAIGNDGAGVSALDEVLRQYAASLWQLFVALVPGGFALCLAGRNQALLPLCIDRIALGERRTLGTVDAAPPFLFRSSPIV